MLFPLAMIGSLVLTSLQIHAFIIHHQSNDRINRRPAKDYINTITSVLATNNVKHIINDSKLLPFIVTKATNKGNDDEIDEPKGSSSPSTNNKKIVFIRHGLSYINEYLGGDGIDFGQPGFTDVFDNEADKMKYHDSPLSETGVKQALELKSKLQHHFQINDTLNEFSNKDNIFILDELDLVVVSPLMRALQTMDLSLSEYLENENRNNVPVLAVPDAAERLYLVSDLGKTRTELRQVYPYIDFDTAFDSNLSDDDYWHFIPTENMQQNYVEWRPHGQGQTYSCLGEPQDYFDRRMSKLYYWLHTRPEKCIAVVCHAGVIEWLTSGEIFRNCELRMIPFKQLKPRTLV